MTRRRDGGAPHPEQSRPTVRDRPPLQNHPARAGRPARQDHRARQDRPARQDHRARQDRPARQDRLAGPDRRPKRERPARYGALLAAILVAVLAVSSVIFVGVSADRSGGRDTLAGSGALGLPVAPASAGTWVTAWTTSPGGAEPGTETAGLAGRSVRNVVHTAAGGTRARVTLSNLYGRSPLTLTHASVAVAAGRDTAAALPETMRLLTFAGNPSVVVPAGGQVVSDVVRVRVPRDGHVLISTYSPVPSGPVTFHKHARQISWVAEGEHTRDTTGAAYSGRSTVWRYVTALDVLSDDSEGTVVVLGDSLTDGITSTVGADARWPDVLSGRLRAALAAGRDLPRYSVVNAGLSGNEILADRSGTPPENPSALRRFDRDVLGRANVEVVVVVLGVNDILRAPGTADPERIVGGLTALVERAHARGIKAVGATLMPFGGHRKHTDAREDVRRRVNAAIRDGGVFDAVVDFDEAVRDGYDPRRFRAGYDSGDGLHPSDEGYARMAEAFDLDALKGGAPARL
ncbi:GDSL-type esterase/lipase family protein [Streptomyces sp. CNZ748]|uniref:GDSL-type esterase/lipase family protein n=1 Tax=Streptomyces sp. CNZ748 TaxID=2885160 RepID=UPI001E396F0C|nr:GDSL-type esterase/lipase family protein [Streptomyces sp. CNZ748]